MASSVADEPAQDGACDPESHYNRSWRGRGRSASFSMGRPSPRAVTDFKDPRVAAKIIVEASWAPIVLPDFVSTRTPSHISAVVSHAFSICT